MKRNQFFKTAVFSVILGLCCTMGATAQKINSFSQYRIYKDQYGNTKLKIRPHSKTTNVGRNESKYQSNYGVYGVLICYRVDGKKMAKRQDMTRDLKTQGYYETTLGYGKNTKVSAVRVTYFNMVDMPNSRWPKKSQCY